MNHFAPSLLVLAAVVGCSSPSPVTEAKPDPSPAAPVSAPTDVSAPTEVSAPTSAKVTLVEDPSLVCMVNNQFMGKPQIPVVVEGTTYYGCCEMCKSKLADDPGSRTAIDPVSGASVDKAKAVLGQTDTGAIHYFESVENLAAYARAS